MLNDSMKVGRLNLVEINTLMIELDAELSREVVCFALIAGDEGGEF
jgi:hypothetical protein